LTKHKMDSEQMFVEKDCCDIVNKAKDEGRKVVAVGTTVQRALEACVGTNARIKEYEGWINKFIFPPYQFTVADAMLSNFHLPYSTLLMLTAAFGDYDYTMHAYDVALKEDYQFGPFGDVMLIVD
ncbi:MAG: S-adenosylmethionine:tRNA ribosyltransferase-isomerase, partial [Bacteroidales bacterium]|nr:S-adenosylmethionine:tRNA ribosyltransferase-isomerase [Bacteroidales bacterium]